MNPEQTQTNHNGVDTEIDLSQLDDDFAAAEVVEEREFEAIPDGKYQVNVDRVELTSAKNSGNTMLKWTLRVAGPQFRNRLIWRNNMLVSRENMRWLKQDLNTCGLHIEKVSELPHHLDELLDVKLEVTKRTKGEYENIYFNRRVVTDDEAEDVDGEDNIPF